MEETIQEIISLLLLRFPKFGRDVASITIEYKNDLKYHTGATDGKKIYLDKKYFSSLDTDDKIFLIAHEFMHIKLNHMYRLLDKNGKKRNLEIWNQVTDEIINANLVRDGFKLKEGYLYSEEALKYSAEKLYEKRVQENNPPKKEFMDDHSLWEEAFSKEEKKKESIDEQQEFKENRELKQKILQKKFEEKKKEITKVLQSDSIKRNVSMIERSPVLDWKEYLKKEAEEEPIWTQRRSILENNYAYRLEDYEEEESETEILLDTSGSIDENLLRNFLGECKNIFQNSKIKVGCFDTRFYGFHEIKTESDIENMEYLGGGGTDFDVAISAFTNQSKNKIIFTDGYAAMPKMELDVLWLVFGNTNITPKGGTVIPISEDSLKEMSFIKKVR